MARRNIVYGIRWVLRKIKDVGSSGSACDPVIAPVFKTGGRRRKRATVGSTPTRFRHLSMSYSQANHSQIIWPLQSHLHDSRMSLFHLVRDHISVHVHCGADVTVPHKVLLHGNGCPGSIQPRPVGVSHAVSAQPSDPSSAGGSNKRSQNLIVGPGLTAEFNR